ncbi:sugar phosphate isomerase/epimerase family protein [Aureimonas pseudogalii]|uniref:Sugar phosphate isomerase/epimerase n=1 Tax=Aureimonas pseudogalii TaxID=1744844 RepID=A0A7W6EHF2_9HYPH|nr:sugar phosphate isomerase/epimerase family protein [Aureimonas pseudogalii]MBB3998533.1 sugar phosphate isomerase/epimerase [Aureimonas pseudogalii]
MTSDTKLDRTNWPIAAAMIQYPGTLPDGRSTQDQSAEEWSATLADVSDAGFTELDPTDGWLRIADLEPSRLNEFLGVVADHGLTIPAVSTARKNLVDPAHGEAHLAYGHRLLDTAAGIGAKAVSFGFFGPLNEAQKKALWFWTVQGERNPDDAGTWNLAVERVRDLGRHAADLGLEISLEMYEDTLIGTADGAVRLVTDVDLPNVKINADLGNLIRLHRPVEHWQTMMEKVAPFAGYWHVKNYTRIEDETTGAVMTAPAPLEFGLINYRTALRMALAHGFRSALLVEHYGGDGLSVSATNRDYLRRILPRPETHA